MGIFITLLKVFYAGTMSVYPTMNMYGTGMLQSFQAGYRIVNHFGLIKSSRPLNPGPTTEQGSYAWWQDATLIFKNSAPLVQQLLRTTAK